MLRENGCGVVPDRVERDLLVGLADVLDTAGAATYRASGGYLADETAVVFGDLPTGPDRVVALALYQATDAIEQNLSTRRMQVMMRSVPNDSLDVGDLADDVFDALHVLENTACGVVHVVQCFRTSVVPLGMDEQRRYLRADNYQLDINTPATPGRP